MNKTEVAAYFDNLAPKWDADIVTDDQKIARILDAAGVHAGSAVLDVACGTGVLFPYYLARNVASVVGVDISSEMARIAAKKTHDPRVEVLCADMETLDADRACSCGIVYNAFPHFANRDSLIARLAAWIEPGGRLAIAHGMSLDALHAHHAGSAAAVSLEMLSAKELTELLSPLFDVDIAFSDEHMYLVAGTRRLL